MVKTIFFDLDGTLTDPKVGITRSIEYALKEMNILSPHVDELTWCIGPPLLESLTELTGNGNLGAQALKLYRERYANIGMFENEVYPGIASLLAELAASGKRLFVATSKPHAFARPILSHFNLVHFFSNIFGAELDGTRSDKSELIRHALDTSDEPPNTSLMVGDRKHDIIGAHNNNLKAIGVTYGYGSIEELTLARAGKIVSNVDELRACLA